VPTSPSGSMVQRDGMRHRAFPENSSPHLARRWGDGNTAGVYPFPGYSGVGLAASMRSTVRPRRAVRDRRTSARDRERRISDTRVRCTPLGSLVCVSSKAIRPHLARRKRKNRAPMIARPVWPIRQADYAATVANHHRDATPDWRISHYQPAGNQRKSTCHS
jgi:hypothetical protein